jgi:hypothetical protein
MIMKSKKSKTQLGSTQCTDCTPKHNNGESEFSASKISITPKFFRRVVFLFILCIVGYIFYAIIYPSIYPPKIPNITEKNLRIAEKKLRALEFKKERKITFTNDEITVLYNKYFLNETFKKKPLIITVNNKNSLSFTIYIQFHYFTHFSIPLTITGEPVFKLINNQKTITKFHINKISIGNFPIPKSSYKKIPLRFVNYYTKRTSSTINSISDIKIHKNKDITFTLK